MTRCHYSIETDGTATLIPGCWNRVHDPDADCLCGHWSEAEAAKKIAKLIRQNRLLAAELQRLERTLRQLPDHAHLPLPRRAVTATNGRGRRIIVIEGTP